MKDLSAVTPQDVRTAVRLCDELGEKEFLARYGFGRSTRYGLHVDGAVYPSKAILGVAHEFATGTALTSDSFFGGQQETVRILERLGFDVLSDGSDVTSGPAKTEQVATYMLLWSPTGPGWNDLERLDILDGTLAGERVEGRWSIHANRRQVNVGDRVFVRRTGRSTPGIIASGWVSSEVFRAKHWDPSRSGETTYVYVAWDSMVGIEEALDLSAVAEEFPDSMWGARSSGALVPGDIADELERAWAQHLAAVDGEHREGAGAERYREAIIRDYAEVIVRRRRHQRAFRKLLLAEQENRCAYDGCGIDEVRILEAAHIQPDSEGGEPTTENGLLLCPNHHRAMDTTLLSYDGADFHWTPGTTPF